MIQPPGTGADDSDYHIQIGMEKIIQVVGIRGIPENSGSGYRSECIGCRIYISLDAGKTAFQGIQDIQPGFSVHYNSNREGELNVALFSSGSVFGFLRFFLTGIR